MLERKVSIEVVKKKRETRKESNKSVKKGNQRSSGKRFILTNAVSYMPKSVCVDVL